MFVELLFPAGKTYIDAPENRRKTDIRNMTENGVSSWLLFTMKDDDEQN